MKFQKFKKIPRLNRDIIITEKIDGTNGVVNISSYSAINDFFIIDSLINNRVHAERLSHDFINKYSLGKLEIVKFDNTEDHFIFAGSRTKWITPTDDNFCFAKWVKDNSEELILKLGEGYHYGEWYGQGIQRKYNLDEKRFALFNIGKWADDEVRPKCCDVVPVLYKGVFDTNIVNDVLDQLSCTGSIIVPGFMNPEGLIVLHKASGNLFKVLVENDDKPKGD